MSVDQVRATTGTADPVSAGGPAPFRSVRVVAWVLVGMVVLQTAWILALPPFRGTDEFNHVFRAASVARGEWRPPHHVAEHGRGDLVRVPRDIVAAAHAQCASLEYTMVNDCNPVRTVGDGEVLIATSASRYNPTYYWIVGTAALPFHGPAALYAMRIASSILCSMFVGLAVWAIGRWARTAWPLGLLLVAMTPVAVFSSVVVAPNGLEICAALALWASFLGLSRAKDPRAERRLLYAMIPSAAVLATVRPLGPGFLALAVVTAVLAGGPVTCWRIVHRNRREALLLAGTALIAVLGNVYWLASSDLSQVSLHRHNPHALTSSFRLLPSQFLQVFAAFPYRDVPAPAIVYTCMIIVVLAALVAGVKASTGAVRLSLLLGTLGVFAGPFLFTLMTYSAKGSFWQGRYGLPFIVGVPLIVGLALDRKPPKHGLVKPFAVVCVALLALAHSASPTHMMQMELRRPASVDDGMWLHPEVWVVPCLVLAAWALFALALRAAHTNVRTT